MEQAVDVRAGGRDVDPRAIAGEIGLAVVRVGGGDTDHIGAAAEIIGDFVVIVAVFRHMIEQTLS